MQILNKKMMITIVISSFVLFIVPSCKQSAPRLLPSALVGTWVTDDLRYKDRYIEFSNNMIVLGAGEADSYQLFINKTAKNVTGSVTEWIFFCDDLEGNPSEIVIFYQAPTGTTSTSGSIKLKNNKKVIWYKTE